jgi:diguanylate cyclase (GGDEF)-like protein
VQYLVPKTRRLLIFTLTCVAVTLVVMDAAVLWLPSHPQFQLVILGVALLISIGVILLASFFVVRLRTLVGMAQNSHRNESLFLAASDSSFDSFSILESVRNVYGEITDFRVVYINENGAKLLSGKPQDVQGKLLCETYPAYRTEDFFETFKRVADTGVQVTAEFPVEAKEIRASWLKYHVVKVGDGVAITSSDITDAKQKDLMLVYLAHHDSLTSLARRELFDERLEDAIHRAAEQNRFVGLLTVDCDHMKRVNDMLGHQAGDEVLTQIAERLKSAVRRSDTVARMGGDEFVIVLCDLTDVSSPAAVAEDLLLSLQAPVFVAGQALQISVSIGVCVYPKDGTSAAELLKNADAAMYQAKADGRSQVQAFTRDMFERLARRRELETGLEHALERNEFSLVYQPRINLLTGTVNGVEALLRWHSAHLGLVMPGEFISIAEESGMIVPIGRWVIETACREMHQLYPEGSRSIQLAINVSPRQFQQESLVRDIVGSLLRNHIDPKCLEIEITESMLMHESTISRHTFDALRAHGVSIAIDDFGTGYSSMSYLVRFRVERLKVDQLFVRRMTLDPESDAICRALVGLAQALGMAVVAEGVETEQHRELLWAMGCEEAQGNLYSVPVPIDELSATIESIERRAVRRFAVA